MPILKEDFLLFTMVTLKSIPPGRKVPKFTKTRQVLRNAGNTPKRKKCRIYEMFHVNSAECCRKMCHFFIADSKEDFLLFTMVTLKSIPPGRESSEITKTRQVLRNAVIPPKRKKCRIYEMFHVNSAECCRKMCHFFIADS
ncbi:unnamed protein product [Clavelina lepadiformis]|uniref:Ribosomal protein S10 n=1 Tax=Clavelina lepadiformis TaxID=159417 RepID=A0ABP0FPP1_CLALP